MKYPNPNHQPATAQAQARRPRCPGAGSISHTTIGNVMNRIGQRWTGASARTDAAPARHAINARRQPSAEATACASLAGRLGFSICVGLNERVSSTRNSRTWAPNQSGSARTRRQWLLSLRTRFIEDLSSDVASRDAAGQSCSTGAGMGRFFACVLASPLACVPPPIFASGAAHAKLTIGELYWQIDLLSRSGPRRGFLRQRAVVRYCGETK